MVSLEKVCAVLPKLKMGDDIFVLNKKLKKFYVEPLVKIDFSYSTTSWISGYIATKDEIDKDNNCYMFSKYGKTWVFTREEAEKIVEKWEKEGLNG